MEARNIIQGGVGDCYFMSAIAGVAEHYPELLYRLFVLDRNPASIYGIKLFIDGAWQTEILDACFPVNLFGHFIYAKPHNHAIWVLLLEKAWAKVYGSYDAIHAGYADEGMVALTGAPCENLLSDQDGTIDKLRIYLRKGYLISCSSSDMLGQMSERDQ
jgi:calpain-15